MTYGYIRVSTDKQDVENQKIGINRRSVELNLVIDEWISDEGVSGTKEYNERNLGVLMKKLKDSDNLIISEISRLARSVFMLFRIIEELVQKKNVSVYMVKDSINVLRKNDIISLIGIAFLGIAAQIERDMIVKRTKESLERRKQEGIVLGRPVGKKSEYTKLDGKESKIIKYINKGISYTSIARFLGVSRVTLHVFCKKKGLSKNQAINTNPLFRSK